MALPKPMPLVPELLLLSYDHFQRVCEYMAHVCVCVFSCRCAFTRTDIGSSSSWKATSREAANTALGRWKKEQSKQGTGQNSDAISVLGHALTYTNARIKQHTYTRTTPFQAKKCFHIQHSSPILHSDCVTSCRGRHYYSTVSKSTAFDSTGNLSLEVHRSGVSNTKAIVAEWEKHKSNVMDVLDYCNWE